VYVKPCLVLSQEKFYISVNGEEFLRKREDAKDKVSFSEILFLQYRRIFFLVYYGKCG